MFSSKNSFFFQAYLGTFINLGIEDIWIYNASIFFNLKTAHLWLKYIPLSMFALLLGKIKGNRRRGWQKMRWLGSITDSMDMNVGKLWETVKDRGAWRASVHRLAESWTDSETEKWQQSRLRDIINLYWVLYFVTATWAIITLSCPVDVRLAI